QRVCRSLLAANAALSYRKNSRAAQQRENDSASPTPLPEPGTAQLAELLKPLQLVAAPPPKPTPKVSVAENSRKEDTKNPAVSEAGRPATASGKAYVVV